MRRGLHSLRRGDACDCRDLPSGYLATVENPNGARRNLLKPGVQIKAPDHAGALLAGDTIAGSIFGDDRAAELVVQNL
jgi:hypothetical protein